VESLGQYSWSLTTQRGQRNKKTISCLALVFPTAKEKPSVALLSEQCKKDQRMRNTSRGQKIDRTVDTIQKRSGLGGKCRSRCVLNRLHSFYREINPS